jgi:8-oxo-dGTP pyrophosphatase MutT (NUDIX family)
MARSIKPLSRPAHLSADDFVSRVAGNAPAFHTDIVGDHTFNPEIADMFMEIERKPAAVLIPIVMREPGATMLFTQRTDNLSSHPGQVAFPGGKIDDSDVSAEAAALREAEEEIGLKPDDVEMIGRAPDYLTGSGYHIAPVLGLVKPDARYKLNEYEVSDIFEVPLSFLMDPANHVIGSRVWQGVRRTYYEMPYEDRYIWGVTAGMVRILYERLYGDEA